MTSHCRLIAVSRLVLLILIACGGSKLAAASAPLTAAGPQIRQVESNTGIISRYDKFEITFQIANSTASTPHLPYDPTPPAGVTPGTGISVEALLSNDNWATTFVQPAFIYQDFVRSRHNGFEHIYPLGKPVWKVRFAPRQTGLWRYRLRATDAGGTTYYPANADLNFVVTESNLPGFLHVSRTDPRYFEFDDGTPFIGVGHNESFETNDGGVSLSTYAADERLARFQETGTNFARPWLSGAGIAGSAWAPWTSHIRDYYGNVPYITLMATEAYNANGLSLVLTPYDACVFQGFQGGPVPVLPDKTYRLTARVKTVNVNAPATPRKPFGFTVKLGSWLGRTGDPDNPLHCDDPGQGTALIPHVSGTTDWHEASGTFTTSSDQYFLGNFYLVLDNALVTNNPATEGKVYIDEVRVQEILPGGQPGPNVIKKPNMNMHTYFDQAPAWKWDYILDRATEAGVYLKLVVLEKDDLLYSRIGPDGIFNPDHADDDNTYAQPHTRVRWLHQAWWRYLIARWGYSTAVHSWELLNEGDPYDEKHYEQARAMAEYMRQHDPSRHMVTTSFWSGYPVSDFWANPAYRAIDYADVHAYISTGEGIYAFWGDGFEPPLALESDTAYTYDSAGWSIRIPGNQPFEYANRITLNIRGQGEWRISYQMKAQNFKGICDDGAPVSLAGPRLFWDLGQGDAVINSNQVPPSPTGNPQGCAAPAGTYNWTEFSSDRTAAGDPAPTSTRLVLDNDGWHELVLYFRNNAGTGGRAWIDNIQVIDPRGKRLPINGHFDLSRMDFDAALYTAARSLRDGATSPIGPGKPVVRGEAGLDYPDRQEEQADLARDQQGIWFHNFVWGQINPGGMYELYWWTENIWSKNLHRHVKPFQDFMRDMPLNNGHYVDAEVITSHPDLHVLGQKDLINHRAHLWIQNRQHTWRNVVDGLSPPGLNGTFTLPDLAPGLYLVEWWDPYSGDIIWTETTTANPTLGLQLPQLLKTDVAVKVRRAWSLSASSNTVDRSVAEPGDILNYTITLINPGPRPIPVVQVTDPAPSDVTFLANSGQSSGGEIALAPNLLEWSGQVPVNEPVTITFRAQIDPGLDEDTLKVIVNQTSLADGYMVIDKSARTIVNGVPAYLPFVNK